MPLFNKDGKPLNGTIQGVKMDTRVHFMNGVVQRIELSFTHEEFAGQFFTHQIYPVLASDCAFEQWDPRHGS